MAAPYSLDLRKRVVAAVERGGMSRNQAAAHFGVAISTAITWVKVFRQTGSLAPGQMGGHKPRATWSSWTTSAATRGSLSGGRLRDNRLTPRYLHTTGMCQLSQKFRV
jgi:transposase-like protein